MHPDLMDPDDAVAFLRRHPAILDAAIWQFLEDLRAIWVFRQQHPQSFPSLPPERRRDPTKRDSREIVSDALSRYEFPPLAVLWKLVSAVCTDMQWREKYGPLSEDERRIQEVAWRMVKALDVAEGKRTVARDI